MTTDAITSWLEAPAIPLDSATLDTALRTWPWFGPVRLMEAVREHQQAPFSDKTLAALWLYGSDWLTAYDLLLEKEEPYIPDEEADEDEAFTDEFHTSDEDLYEQPEAIMHETSTEELEEQLIQPLYTEDYFRHQGIPAIAEEPHPEPEPVAEPQTLMVMMSFAEWLNHFKVKSQKEEEEAQEKRALRSMWQQEKLAAAMEDEPEEIPEDVFEMAVSSITKEDDIVSEPLAQIYERQEKWSAAADMYRKLALKYPAKSTYFASRAEAAKKRQL